MEIKEHPNYRGYQISRYLENPELTLVQERLPIYGKFRVEVLGGHVLGNGSTIDRWWYAYNYGFYGLRKEDYVPPTEEEIHNVE